MSTRISSFGFRSADDYQTARSKNAVEEKKAIWPSMLDSVSRGRRLPQKTVLVLGGTPDTQKEFLDSLNLDLAKKREQNPKKAPPIAHQFALGYTWQDIVDTQHDDTLARLSLYLLADPSPSFNSLLKPIFTEESIPNMLIVILLDWNDPWNWARQLRDWIRFLRSLIIELNIECKDAMEENIKKWQSGDMQDGLSEAIPLGRDGWDEPLGVPLCVVCQNANKLEDVSRAEGWGDAELDFMMQFIRTVLLKHGASLISTMPLSPGPLPALIHYWLGIHETAKKTPLVASYTDPKDVLIPPGWDAHAKIRTLSDGFNPEDISDQWSDEIQRADGLTEEEPVAEGSKNDILAAWSNVISPPIASLNRGAKDKSERVEVETVPHQEFLEEENKVLQHHLAEDDDVRKSQRDTRPEPGRGYSTGAGGNDVEDHIGPVQFNMGGIQVDAEDVITKINNRETERNAESGIVTEGRETSSGLGASTDVNENARLKEFFARLSTMPRSASPRPQ